MLFPTQALFLLLCTKTLWRDIVEIFAWSAGTGGCEFYRLEAPLKAVEDTYQWDINIDMTMPVEMVQGVKLPDILIMQRACKPGPSDLFRHHMRTFPELRGVCEFDDNLWDIDKANYARAYYNNPEFMGNLAANLEAATAITVSTEPLAKQLIRFQPKANRKVYVLPNQLPDWAMDLPQREHHDGSEGPVIIAYPASANHAGDVFMVGHALRKLITKYPGKVIFKSIGADFRSQLRVPESEQIGWVGDMAAYYSIFSTFDICIAPLAPTPFNDAKSEIKALESWRGNIPIVGTKFGPYERHVEHDVDGMLCMDEDDWFKYLRDLVFDHDRRREMGEAGRKKVLDRTFNQAAPTWAALYKKLLG